MADDVVMETAIAQEQNDDWKAKLETFIADRRPTTLALSGTPATDEVQPALDKFVKDVNDMFDDNLDLGLVLHSAMVGQRQLMIEADES